MAKGKERYSKSVADRIKRALRRIARRPPEPEHPDDPYALVGAPKKPRTPLRGLAAAVDPERD
ncbi:MAG: hypothetical protein JO307_02285 [Bryobacterales bacterium]|nr:hypothetical protein [Bryobacterales bacterium]MBV9398961.1 hypothetical protein [Bryobacterales bacterium]